MNARDVELSSEIIMEWLAVAALSKGIEARLSPEDAEAVALREGLRSAQNLDLQVAKIKYAPAIDS